MLKRPFLRSLLVVCVALCERVALADTPVSGFILTDATWTLAGSPYIVTGTVYVQNVAPGPTLTIQAGVTVKFNAGTALEIGFNGPGALQAVGTSGQPIVFTANSASPPRGFWQWVRFSSHALPSSQISYATVSYGQGLRVEGSSPTMDNLMLSSNTQAGLTVTGGSPVLSNSTADSNDRGVYVSYPGSPSLQSVSLTNNTGFAISVETKVTLGVCAGVTATGNGTNGIEMRPCCDIDVATTWRNVSGLPYVVIAAVYAYRVSGPFAVFSIEPGTTIRWRQGSGLLVSSFVDFEAVGTAVQPITFTSDSATPHAGDWGGIQVWTTPSHISYATIQYSGSSVRAALHIGTASPTIDHCTVSDNNFAAFGVQGGSPTITNSTLSNSPWGVYLTQSSSPSIAGTTISGNTTGGVYAEAAVSPSFQNVTITSNLGYAMSLSAATTLGDVAGLVISGNTYDAVELRGDRIQQNVTWKNLGVPNLYYAVTGALGCWVEGTGSNNPVLTIDAGVSLRFALNGGLRIGTFGGGKGQLQAIGTPSQPISFGPLSGSVPGSWSGLVFVNSPITSHVSYATVTYADRGISIAYPGPFQVGTVALDHVTLSSNATAGVSGGGGSSTISNCSFIGNPAAIQTTESGLKAMLNWWDSATGPSGIGPGTGESVSAGVLYEPWLTALPSSLNYIASATVANRRFNPLSSDWATWNLTSSEPGNWTITISDNSATVVRTLTGSSTPIVLQWDGKDDSGTVTEPDGRYTYLIQTSAGADTATPAKGFVFVDRTFQLAITSPTEGFVISNLYQTGPDVTVSGSVAMSGLTSWELDFGLGASPSSWTLISSGTQPVLAGTLGIWSTIPIDNGTYTLRLLASDNQQSQVVRYRTVVVSNFKVTQSVLQMNASAGNTVTYTSVLPVDLTETLFVKNAGGQTVRTLVNAVARTAGTYPDVWDGRNDSAGLLRDGPYSYIASVTDGTHSLTWDLTNQYLNDWSTYGVTLGSTFDPFNNTPLSISYSFAAPSRVSLGFYPPGFNGGCSPPSFCMPQDQYTESGPHTAYWAGVDPTGAFSAATATVAAYSSRALFSKNAIVLFGTKPSVTNVAVTPSVYGPSIGTQTVSFTLATFQSQPAALTVTFLNQLSVSILRTISVPSQAPGNVTLMWDGRADNGMLVAPGFYTVTVTATDPLGNVATGQILTTVRY